MIRILLWDVDGTLMDFKAAEKAAVRTLFSEFGLGECTDEMIRRYSALNEAYWKRLEKGEITKPEVLIGRFREFFGQQGIDPELAPEFNSRYQLRLGDTIVYRDNSFDLVRSLKGKVLQYAVSNGTVTAQRKKLERSGFDKLFDGVFLSEELKAEKPSPLFFSQVFERIAPAEKDEIMIIGDSLTSDIRGGIAAGIRTCWYNPEGKPVPEGFAIDHVIRDLGEVPGVAGISG